MTLSMPHTTPHVVFRAVRAAVAALKQAGAAACDLSLARDGDSLNLRLVVNLSDGEELDAAKLAADMIAFAAYGSGVTVSGDLPAPGMELPDEPLLIAADAADDDAKEADSDIAEEEAAGQDEDESDDEDAADALRVDGDDLIPLGEVTWADWNQRGRLVIARAGVLSEVVQHACPVHAVRIEQVGGRSWSSSFAFGRGGLVCVFGGGGAGLL